MSLSNSNSTKVTRLMINFENYKSYSGESNFFLPAEDPFGYSGVLKGSLWERWGGFFFRGRVWEVSHMLSSWSYVIYWMLIEDFGFDFERSHFIFLLAIEEHVVRPKTPRVKGFLVPSERKLRSRCNFWHFLIYRNFFEAFNVDIFFFHSRVHSLNRRLDFHLLLDFW